MVGHDHDRRVVTRSQIAYELGVAFALSGQVGPSACALAEAVRLDPRDGWTKVVYGLVLLEDDRLDEALEDDTQVYEYKTGPYMGQAKDKEFI